MFGLAERARLAMYRSTLRQAISDEDGSGLFHSMALMTSMLTLGNAANYVAGRKGVFQFEPTLSATIENIPSRYLADIDAVLVRDIAKPRLGEQQHLYQMETLINSLVFIRIVEVSRPSLHAKASEYRSTALDFIEPLYRMGLDMMMSREREAD